MLNPLKYEIMKPLKDAGCPGVRFDEFIIDGKPVIAWAMRPDELVLMITLLSQALNRIAKVWEVGPQKEKKRY